MFDRPGRDGDTLRGVGTSPPSSCLGPPFVSILENGPRPFRWWVRKTLLVTRKQPIVWKEGYCTCALNQANFQSLYGWRVRGVRVQSAPKQQRNENPQSCVARIKSIFSMKILSE